MTTLEIGPIDYLVIEFPGSQLRGEILPELVELVERRVIRILDLVIVRKHDDGTVVGAEIGELSDESMSMFEPFAPVLHGVLADDDIAAIGTALEPGATAAAILWENSWAAPLTAAVAAAGGELVAGGRVDLAALHEALTAAGRENH